jgi:hypothetical protein
MFVAVVAITALGRIMALDIIVSAAGVHKISPDGHFDAIGTIAQSCLRSWVIMEVRDRRLDKTIYYRKESLAGSDEAPWFDQGLQQRQGITWQADSSGVEFEGKNEEKLFILIQRRSM